MEGQSRVSVLGISFNGLLTLIGIILCILQGAGTVRIGWVYACIPFMILAVEIGIAMIFAIIAFIVMICSRE